MRELLVRELHRAASDPDLAPGGVDDYLTHPDGALAPPASPAQDRLHPR